MRFLDKFINKKRLAYNKIVSDYALKVNELSKEGVLDESSSKFLQDYMFNIINIYYRCQTGHGHYKNMVKIDVYLFIYNSSDGSKFNLELLKDHYKDNEPMWISEIYTMIDSTSHMPRDNYNKSSRIKVIKEYMRIITIIEDIQLNSSLNKLAKKFYTDERVYSLDILKYNQVLIYLLNHSNDVIINNIISNKQISK